MSKRAFVLLTSVTLIIVMSQLPRMFVSAQESVLPAPTGPYQVGVTSLTLIDGAREEIFTSEPGDSRAVTVFVWYPADVPQGATPSPYMNGFVPEDSGLEMVLGLCCADLQKPKDVASVVEWLNNLQRHAFQDVPISPTEAAYPVVIYSNIVSGMPIIYSLHLEELASHGYIVIDVIHTFGYGIALSGNNVVVNGVPVEYAAFETNANKDILFVLDQLQLLNSNNPENPFGGRLNLDQIGVVGGSSGGWPVIEAANVDKRIKAGISQEGDEAPITWKGSQPFMFMAGGGIVHPQMQRDYDHAAGPAFFFQVNEFRHFDFLDEVLWHRLINNPGFFGTIEGTRTVKILRTYVVAFFDQYLKGQDQPLLDGPSLNFPEVTIESRNTD